MVVFALIDTLFAIDVFACLPYDRGGEDVAEMRLRRHREKRLVRQ
jgi:hypothetical protein